MVKIVLTADRAIFTDYSGVEGFGFGLCLPCRLIPRIIEYYVLAPKTPADSRHRSYYAPYPLSKLEASLIAAGFSRDEVAITPPEHVDKVVDKDTVVVAVHVIDPRGLAPVSWTLKTLMGGGVSCTEYEFMLLMRKLIELKKRYGFKIVVGGPGVWQLEGMEDKLGIDTVFYGEGELEFPILVKKVIEGDEIPKKVYAKPVSVDHIPPILTPARGGLVEITRGCPRGCQFCSPTTKYFRSIPLETILKEVEINVSKLGKVGFITEDIFLYGARGLQFNKDAVKKLYIESLEITRRYGFEKIGFTHATPSSLLANKDLVKFISDSINLSEDDPLYPQMGLETGSPRIVEKYFRGKPLPWGPRDWPEIVLKASIIANDNYLYPCYTYIIGFPDETIDDYVKTIELIDELRSIGFLGWTFPLILIPIGGTLISKSTSFKSLNDMPREAIDAIKAGWIQSILFTEKIVYKYLSKIRSPFVKKIVDGLSSIAIDAMKKWVSELSTDPEKALKKYALVDIRHKPLTVLKYIVIKKALIYSK